MLSCIKKILSTKYNSCITCKVQLFKKKNWVEEFGKNFKNCVRILLYPILWFHQNSLKTNFRYIVVMFIKEIKCLFKCNFYWHFFCIAHKYYWNYSINEITVSVHNFITFKRVNWIVNWFSVSQHCPSEGKSTGSKQANVIHQIHLYWLPWLFSYCTTV